jgi:hypothetical protein
MLLSAVVAAPIIKRDLVGIIVIPQASSLGGVGGSGFGLDVKVLTRSPHDSGKWSLETFLLFVESVVL